MQGEEVACDMSDVCFNETRKSDLLFLARRPVSLNSRSAAPFHFGSLRW